MTKEDLEQAALFTFIRCWETRYPILKAVYAIPNGLFTTAREKGEAVQCGLRAGVWDIHIAVPRFYSELPITPPIVGGTCPGAYIEMKYGRNTLTDKQVEFRDLLKPYGFQFYICHDWMEAARAVLSYLGLEDTDAWKTIPPK